MGLTTKAGEGFIESLTKNLSTSYGELAQEIAGNYTKSVQKQVVKTMKNIDHDGDTVTKKIFQAIETNNKNIDFSDKMQKTVKSSISDKEKFDWIRKQQVERHGALAGNAVFAGQVAKAYMFQDGKKAARWGTYAAGSVGLRVVSGGSLTHNNTGERDIAGIPFI